MPSIVVVGVQWGDEGKGKITDLYAEHAECVVRFNGGNNAGHTIVVDGKETLVNLIPAGFAHAGKQLVLGNGMVIDPRWLLREIRVLKEQGFLADDRWLHISDLAHVVMPYHRALDNIGSGIGSTRNGIGPTYASKIGRRGIHMRELLKPSRLAEHVAWELDYLAPYLAKSSSKVPPASEIVDTFAKYGEQLRRYITDTSKYVYEQTRQGKRVMFEGAQGSLLDIDHGTYPHVTSSSVVAGGACTGTGIGPTTITGVIGILKAYMTRAGGGPFPTLLAGADEETLREAGHEYCTGWGPVPMRVGWLDAASLRQSVRLNGISSLAITKLDVLSCFSRVKICVGYMVDGERRDELPRGDEIDDAVPIYEELDSWPSVRGTERLEALPPAARRYLERIEHCAGVPVRTVSIGPDRSETVGMKDPFAETSA